MKKRTRNAEIRLSSRKYIHSFMQDIDQSEAEDSFQLASYWTKSVRKNVNKSKAVTL